MNFFHLFFRSESPGMSQWHPAGNKQRRAGWLFAADNLFIIGRNLGFLEDKAFMDAWKKHAQIDIEKSIVWRNYVLAWAARSVLSRKVPGDFVECACYMLQGDFSQNSLSLYPRPGSVRRF